MFSDNNVIKLEINTRKYLKNTPNIWKHFYINLRSKKEITREIKKIKNVWDVT